MAVYFDHKIEGIPGATYTHIQWHKVHQIVAVASYGDSVGGSVNLYVNEVSIHLSIDVFLAL